MKEDFFELLGGEGLESSFTDGFPGRVSAPGVAVEGSHRPGVMGGGVWPCTDSWALIPLFGISHSGGGFPGFGLSVGFTKAGMFGEDMPGKLSGRMLGGIAFAFGLFKKIRRHLNDIFDTLGQLGGNLLYPAMLMSFTLSPPILSGFGFYFCM